MVEVVVHGAERQRFEGSVALHPKTVSPVKDASAIADKTKTDAMTKLL